MIRPLSYTFGVKQVKNNACTAEERNIWSPAEFVRLLILKKISLSYLLFHKNYRRWLIVTLYFWIIAPANFKLDRLVAHSSLMWVSNFVPDNIWQFFGLARGGGAIRVDDKLRSTVVVTEWLISSVSPH